MWSCPALENVLSETGASKAFGELLELGETIVLPRLRAGKVQERYALAEVSF
ncbi:MAG: hypothetical protein V3V76_10120 [Candidatus Adiutricales bacterium]